MNFSVPFDLTENIYGSLSVTEKEQINAWRRSAFQVRQRFINQKARFPESYVARARKLAEPAEILVPDDQRVAAFGLHTGRSEAYFSRHTN